MTLGLDQKLSLEAHVTNDGRGLDLLRIFVSVRRVGYPKYGRINAEGGITYIHTRDGNVAPANATLVLSKDEAQVIANALGSYIYGPGWGATPEEAQRLRDELAASEKQNAQMRKGKKAVEAELAAAKEKVQALHDIEVRHNEVMSVVQAMGNGLSPRTELRDCCD